MTPGDVTQRIDIGALSLSVTDYGDGPPILFLHGFPEDGAAWGKVAKLLSDRFRCILPDQRGYGRSDQPGAVVEYRVDKLIADIDALADVLGLETFALAGHDWGGVVAWWYAARHAERLSHLIIANAPHPALFQSALIDDPDQRLACQYVTRLREPGSESQLAGATKAMVNWYRAAPFVVPAPGEAAAMPDWVAAEDFTIAVPTLVLWGMRDTALLPVLLGGLDTFVPDLRVERFAEAGHNIIHDIPTELAAAIGAFLA
jgi:pimeloyl-ACP methyl ester carboxylesterase